MKSYRITRFGEIDGLVLGEEPDPKPGPREALVRVRANALNFLDLMVVLGQRVNPTTVRPELLIPLSDGAGDVVEIGAEVTNVKVGDRVAATFYAGWEAGPPTLAKISDRRGSTFDGMLRELVAIPEDQLIKIPASLSFAEAATLPCAGLTAWSAINTPRPLQAGETVLVLGSGGVSLFALQYAKAQSARVFATTTSPDKQALLRNLGAENVVNRRSISAWPKQLREWTKGAGIDRIVEVGGASSLAKSLQAVSMGGTICLIGNLAEDDGAATLAALNPGIFSLHRIAVGSREDFAAMNRAIEATGLKPVIGARFPFVEAREAYRALQGQKSAGKIVIEHD